MGLEKDLPPGEALVACFRPFIEHLASSGLAPRTIRRHVGNLWLLGGEIIRDLNYNPSLRKKTAEQLLRHAVYDDGGPLIHNGSEEDQRSFEDALQVIDSRGVAQRVLIAFGGPQGHGDSLDATCRKLHRFLTQSQR